MRWLVEIIMFTDMRVWTSVAWLLNVTSNSAGCGHVWVYLYTEEENEIPRYAFMLCGPLETCDSAWGRVNNNRTTPVWKWVPFQAMGLYVQIQFLHDLMLSHTAWHFLRISAIWWPKCFCQYHDCLLHAGWTAVWSTYEPQHSNDPSYSYRHMFGPGTRVFDKIIGTWPLPAWQGALSIDSRATLY